MNAPWILAALTACGAGVDATEDTDPLTELERDRIARMSPVGDLPPDPTNGVADDPAAAWFGRWLFHDARLSLDGTVSCATCHNPTLDFTDGLALGSALGITARHTPTAWMTGHNRWWFWDGRANSAWAQALGPLENPVEHGTNRTAIAHRIDEDLELRTAYERVFGDLPDLSDPSRFPADAAPGPEGDPWDTAWDAMAPADQDVVNRVFTDLGKAIAAFERTLVLGPTPLDTYVAALKDGGDGLDALNPPQIRGLRLFVGEASCHFCHSGALLTNLEFHNTGLPEEGSLPDYGRYLGVLKALDDPFNGAGTWSDDPLAGAERLGFVAQLPDQLGQFKVPGLRGVGRTAPYMHDGSLATLEEVVDHYVDHDTVPPLGHREELIDAIPDLTRRQRSDLVGFLRNALDAEAPPDLLTGPPDSPIPP